MDRRTIVKGADIRPIHPALIKAALSAEPAKKRVERVANLLMNLMQEMHGGDWRLQISHEVGAEFILISHKPGGDRPVRPVQEVA